MNKPTTETKDPVCGMTVDKATALHVERDGEIFYFCSEHCLEKFRATPSNTKSNDKPGCCCS